MSLLNVIIIKIGGNKWHNNLMKPLASKVKHHSQVLIHLELHIVETIPLSFHMYSEVDNSPPDKDYMG